MRTLPNIDRAERYHSRAVPRHLETARPDRAALAFHRRLPGYAPSPLVELPVVAEELGLERLWLKDESSRLGLPAFKILGASWAAVRALDTELARRTGAGITDDWRTLDDLAAQLAPLRPLTLACATDGNHGRAVARIARWLGFSARVLVPADMSPARIEAIASEGAEVSVIDGTYDDAVDASAHLAGPDCLVISDTTWEGYEEAPRWVVEGYGTILWEIENQLGDLGEPGPDLVLIQIGVGGLAAAVVRHYRRPDVSPAPVIVGVEPVRAACAIASVEAGEVVAIAGPHDSIMSGLNCGIPSAVAWPYMRDGINTFVTVSDDRCRDAMRHLAREGVAAGECGAAGLAGLAALRQAWELHPDARRALIISTEGPTDPDAYRRVVGDE